MLKLDPENPSLIDISEVINQCPRTWNEVELRLNPHPLNLVKSSLKYYSILNREKLGPIFNDLHELFPIYKFDVRKKILSVHHGIFGSVLSQIDIEDIYFSQFEKCVREAVKTGKEAEYVGRLKLAEEALCEVGKRFNFLVDCKIDPIIFEEYLKIMNEYICFEGPIEEYISDMSFELFSAAHMVMLKELYVCGEKPDRFS